MGPDAGEIRNSGRAQRWDPKKPKAAFEMLARIRADSDFLGEGAKVFLELGRNASAKLVELDADAVNKLMKLNARSDRDKLG